MASSLNPIEVSGEPSLPFRSIEHVQGPIDQEHVIHSCRLAGSKVADNALDFQGLGLRIGKPTQNAFVESFNDKFRDECLNEQWFHSIEHARATLSQWRQDCNEQRPHSMLGFKTPAELAEELRNP